MTQERIEAMRRRYPPGTEVTLNSMEGESHMPPGLKGKVDMVDSKSKLSSQFVLDYVSVVVSTPKTTASAGIVSLGVAMFSSFIPVVLAELVG